MRHLDLELLRGLIAVVEYGTFAAAAGQLHKTQSAITQQMQRLEEQVGLPLFEKQGRNKKLTRHGETLLEYSKHMLAIHDEAMRTLHAGKLIGSLRMGAPHDIADTILPPLLTSITRSSPLLQVEIHVGRSPFLMEALKRGEIDLTVSTRRDASLEGVVLRTSPTVWICAADYVHDRNAPVPLILVDEPSLFRKLALSALDSAGVRWRPSHLAGSLAGIKAAIRAGAGVTARSIELLGPDMRVLGESDGFPPLPEVNYYLWIRRDVLTPLTRQVFDTLKNNFGLHDRPTEAAN